jgi:hypothetical protein
MGTVCEHEMASVDLVRLVTWARLCRNPIMPVLHGICG